MKFLKWFKFTKTEICTASGLFGFCLLSGAVPENPDGLTQSIVAIAIILAAVLVGSRGYNPEDNED